MARERELAADLSVAEELMGGATLEDSALGHSPFCVNSRAIVKASVGVREYFG